MSLRTTRKTTRGTVRRRVRRRVLLRRQIRCGRGLYAVSREPRLLNCLTDVGTSLTARRSRSA